MFNKQPKRIAKKLSTDRLYENLYPNQALPNSATSFVVYANNTRWVLECSATWKLYWLPFSEDIKDFSKRSPEYCCSWLPEKMHIRNIKRIIWKHPNCTEWPYVILPTWVIIILKKRK